MSDLKDLELMLKSRVPLIAIETREELQALDMFQRILKGGFYRPLFAWSVTKGLYRLDIVTEPQRSNAQPEDVLKHIRASELAGIYVLLDMHPYLDDPVIIRLIREIVQAHEAAEKTLVLVSPELELPAELRHHAARFEISMPEGDTIRKLVLEEVEDWKHRNRRPVRGDAQAIDLLMDNLAGLSHGDVKRLVRNVIYDDGAITQDDLQHVMAAKYELLGGDGVLSFEADTAHLADVAGLGRLKRWLEQRQTVFTAAEPPRGLDMPRGVLLLGVQGAGKSLAAKAVAGAWKVPLLRLDFATLYNKYYGETERNLRKALKTAQAMAPCVLWIDEIEKGLASDAENGGPSKRILGTILTWMAERHSRVFLVATSNDIETLPPELLRKGRFDEIFFVDLPRLSVREKIFVIHLKKRGHEPTSFDLNALAVASDGFSGAEIEQAIVSAMYTAHARGQQMDTAMVLEELGMTRPLSVVMAEKIAQLRHWAERRTVPAD